MGLTRQPPFPPTVSHWLKTSFKSSSSSSSSFSARKLEDDGMDESFSASEEDTVSLYEDSFSGGSVRYNFSPIDDESAAVDAGSTDLERSERAQKHQPPSLSAMLSELQSDVAPTSSIMTEIVMSLSNIDMGRDWSTPTVFATAVDTFDEATDSTMHLLSCEDERDDTHALLNGRQKRDATEDGTRDENDDSFVEWRSYASHRTRSAQHSPRCSNAANRCHKSKKQLGSMDPVHVYNARDDHIDLVEQRKNSVDYHLGKHGNSSSHNTRNESHTNNDDCTLSSAETALVSNRSSDNARRDHQRMKQHSRSCARASVTAKKKIQPFRKSRWISAFRNQKYMTSSFALSAVSEEYCEG